MKKLIVLLSVLMMAMSVSAFAADDVTNPKLEQAKELRAQAAKASMQAADLNKQAEILELETLKPKAGEKMRGFTDSQYNCTTACMNGHHGDYYSCRQACGGF